MRAVAPATGGGRRGARSAWAARCDDAAVRSVRAQPGARGPVGLVALEHAVLEDLRRVVGREHVIEVSNDLRIFERDASKEGAAPDAVVLPATTAEGSAVIKIASKNRIPV